MPIIPRVVLERLVDPEPCHRTPAGNCSVHLSNVGEDCPHGAAQAILAAPRRAVMTCADFRRLAGQSWAFGEPPSALVERLVRWFDTAPT